MILRAFTLVSVDCGNAMQLLILTVVVLFKGSTTVGQKNRGKPTLQDLSSCRQSGILFFDDFETSNSIRTSLLWEKSHPGVDLEETCRRGGVGNAAHFGNDPGQINERKLLTIPINTTLARAFAFDADACPNSDTISASVSFTPSAGKSTIQATHFHIPANKSRRIVVTITEAMRGEGVRFSVKQTPSHPNGNAWTADNFAVFSSDTYVEQISDDFDDPMQSCTWTEQSGAKLERYCGSDRGRSLVFKPNKEESLNAVTVPIFIPGLFPEKNSVHTSRTILFKEYFRANMSIPNDRWRSISGGSIYSSSCGIKQGNGSKVAFFNGTGERFIESQRFDLTSALTMSFTLSIGGQECARAKSGQDVVLQYSPDGSTDFTDLRQLDYNSKP